MTRKDYELIASNFKDIVDRQMVIDNGDRILAESHLVDVFRIADMIANDLEAENPRFSYGKFMTACGFPNGRGNA